MRISLKCDRAGSQAAGCHRVREALERIECLTQITDSEWEALPDPDRAAILRAVELCDLLVIVTRGLGDGSGT